MWQDLQQKWAELPGGKRKAISIGLMALLLTVGASTMVVKSRGARSLLYTGLAPTETREIAAELARQGVDYTISEDEANISVPTRDEARARMRLASAGLPRSSPEKGWEIFGEGGLAVTKPQQQAMQIRALQGELARSIASLEAVSKAAVHISLKQESPFLAEEEPAKAAVLLHLKPSKTVDRDQAMAIAHLVAKSVPDLETAQITILDEKGALLFSDNVAHGGGGDSDGARKVERELERRVQSQLDMTFGLGKALVRATASFGTQRSEVRRTTYTPVAGSGQGVPAKETIETEDYSGAAAAGRTGGVPGIGGNLFDENARLGGTTGGGGRYNKNKTDREFKVNQEEQLVVQPGGELQRVTLGIFVDESLQSALAKIETVARNAAGIDDKRGDSLSVQAVKFAGSNVDALNGTSRVEMVKTIARLILNALALIIGLLTLRSIIGALKPVPEPTELAPETVAELLEQRPQQALGLGDGVPMALTGGGGLGERTDESGAPAGPPAFQSQPAGGGLTAVPAGSGLTSRTIADMGVPGGDDDEEMGTFTGSGGGGGLTGRSEGGLSGRLTVPGMNSRLFEANDDYGLDPDIVPTLTGPTPEEMVTRVEQTEIDDIAEVMRHWLEGELHEEQV
ncbi:MAG: flagellar M-ring protein FliF [Fimbriimonadaceae bacterium]|nr:flagellar M-ring protein FliF [Fimbriimonadaceae bacterium]